MIPISSIVMAKMTQCLQYNPFQRPDSSRPPEQDNESTEGESKSGNSDQTDSDEETGKALFKFLKLV